MNRRSFTFAGTAALAGLTIGTPAPAQSFQHGFQIADWQDGALRRDLGGMARPGDPVRHETLFQVASCSKTVTALAILTLVRDGRVALDRPVNQSLKRWQLPGPRGKRATPAELLSHTAGTNIHGFAGYGTAEDIPDLIQILRGEAPSNSPAVTTRRRLSKRFDYSGGGTTVLQCLIEDVTDMAFAAYASKAVLIPVGARHATFDLHPRAHHAQGLLETGDPLDGGFRRHPESAAAGLWASATDLVQIMRAILISLSGAPGALLPAPLAQRMIVPVTPNVGLGVLVKPGEVIWHDGRNEGFEAAMAGDLVTGRARAGVTNRNGQMQAVLDADHARYGMD
ncbi:MAG: serine hydrolase domain-containing protein [Pseudomonadota bacterium]